MGRARRICIVSGTRADYGLLVWLMRRVRDSAGLELQLLVTGMHLAPAFGRTVDAIRADGFAIDAEVEMLLAGDTNLAMAKSVGLGTIGCADAMARLGPDLVVVIGDRFEMLAAAGAALLLGIPLAHIHGGEVTLGAVDESIRHAITKMASLHFVAAEPYRARVIQMGEDPARVFTVGAPGLDHLAQLDPLGRAELSRIVGIPLDRPFLLLTYHPATRGERDPVTALDEALAALDTVPDLAVVATKANADAGGQALNNRLAEFAEERPGRVALVASLGQRAYLSALKAAEMTVGNSSSGIIEAPAAGTMTVDIGPRQAGRLRAASVLHADEDRRAIAEAIRRARDPALRARALAAEPPYGRGGDAAGAIAARLGDADLAALRVKRFHDLPERAA